LPPGVKRIVPKKGKTVESKPLDMRPILARFKRTGKLPPIEEADKIGQIDRYYSEALKLVSQNLFSKKLVINFKRELLIREGIEPNPGPCCSVSGRIFDESELIEDCSGEPVCSVVYRRSLCPDCRAKMMFVRKGGHFKWIHPKPRD